MEKGGDDGEEGGGGVGGVWSLESGVWSLELKVQSSKSGRLLYIVFDKTNPRNLKNITGRSTPALHFEL